MKAQTIRKIETERDLEGLSEGCPIEILLADSEEWSDSTLVSKNIFLELIEDGFYAIGSFLDLDNEEVCIAKLKYRFEEGWSRGTLRGVPESLFRKGSEEYQTYYRALKEAFSK